jgi:hypothetical protein
MGWILAIILGGLAGWIASSLMGSAGGLLRNIVIGMLGAVLGNFILDGSHRHLPAGPDRSADRRGGGRRAPDLDRTRAVPDR